MRQRKCVVAAMAMAVALALSGCTFGQTEASVDQEFSAPETGGLVSASSTTTTVPPTSGVECASIDHSFRFDPASTEALTEPVLERVSAAGIALTAPDRWALAASDPAVMVLFDPEPLTAEPPSYWVRAATDLDGDLTFFFDGECGADQTSATFGVAKCRAHVGSDRLGSPSVVWFSHGTGSGVVELAVNGEALHTADDVGGDHNRAFWDRLDDHGDEVQVLANGGGAFTHFDAPSEIPLSYTATAIGADGSRGFEIPCGIIPADLNPPPDPCNEPADVDSAVDPSCVPVVEPPGETAPTVDRLTSLAERARTELSNPFWYTTVVPLCEGCSDTRQLTFAYPGVTATSPWDGTALAWENGEPTLETDLPARVHPLELADYLLNALSAGSVVEVEFEGQAISSWTVDGNGARILCVSNDTAPPSQRTPFCDPVYN